MQTIPSMIERVIEPDWEREIVLIVIYGSLYFADLEMFEIAACTLDYLPSTEASGKNSHTKRPKVGGLLLPNNMFKELRSDVEYLSKVGVEEVLHYFGIPKQHNENCFFHATEFGKAALEDSINDYCSKCREFMRQLEYPLDFEKLFVKMEEIYEIEGEGRGWKEILIRRLHGLMVSRKDAKSRREKLMVNGEGTEGGGDRKEKRGNSKEKEQVSRKDAKSQREKLMVNGEGTEGGGRSAEGRTRGWMNSVRNFG